MQDADERCFGKAGEEGAAGPIMSRGRDAHFCAPPAQIRTWTLAHPAPTSGV